MHMDLKYSPSDNMYLFALVLFTDNCRIMVNISPDVHWKYAIQISYYWYASMGIRQRKCPFSPLCWPGIKIIFFLNYDDSDKKTEKLNTYI